MKPFVVPLGVACVVLTGSGVRAEPAAGQAVSVALGTESDAVRAEKLREEGNQAMLEMRYVDALSLYQQARALAPDYVGVLYSIARARELLGDFPGALSALEEFDRQAAPESKARVGSLDQLFANLRARVGTLELACNVKGARVLVGDRLVGITPLPATRLPSGATTLELELDGFFAESRQIVVPSAGRLVLEVDLHSRASSGLLRVRTIPGGARISVDGKNEGTSTPSIELVLPIGAHRVRASKEGYDDASVPVVLNAGATRALNMPLEKAVPLTSRWWFWTGVAALVTGGALLGAALLSERSADKGTLTPGQIAAPLRF